MQINSSSVTLHAADAAAAPFGSIDATALRVWGLVRAHMLSECGEKTFESWLKPLVLLGLNQSTVRLGVSSRFRADWVKNHFTDRLRRAFAAHIPSIQSIELAVSAATPPELQPAPESQPAVASPTTDDASAFEPRYSFDSFVVGKSNELAFNAAQALATAITSGQTAGFNPLFLHGPTGLGKTHLMHAIGSAVLAQKPGAKLIYLSAEKFMVEFLAALRGAGKRRHHVAGVQYRVHLTPVHGRGPAVRGQRRGR